MLLKQGGLVTTWFDPGLGWIGPPAHVCSSLNHTIISWLGFESHVVPPSSSQLKSTLCLLLTSLVEKKFFFWEDISHISCQQSCSSLCKFWETWLRLQAGLLHLASIWRHLFWHHLLRWEFSSQISYMWSCNLLRSKFSAHSISAHSKIVKSVCPSISIGTKLSSLSHWMTNIVLDTKRNSSVRWDRLNHHHVTVEQKALVLMSPKK